MKAKESALYSLRALGFACPGRADTALDIEDLTRRDGAATEDLELGERATKSTTGFDFECCDEIVGEGVINSINRVSSPEDT
jgi:hypothetical protein